MERVIIFGAGGGGQSVAKQFQPENITCYLDNSADKWGTKIDGIPVCDPQRIKSMEYDRVILATTSGLDEMERQLIELGVPASKIRKPDHMLVRTRAREYFLSNYASLVYEKGMKGSVAEAGVFRGEFASHINAAFPDRKCYLFDTFSGFTAADLQYETNANAKESHLSGTSVQLVMNKMCHPENVIIKQGWFPQSATGVTDTFVFVNLDMDLYKPTFEGIKFFYPLLLEGGVLLLHDFFGEAYPGVRKAVDEYEALTGCDLCKLPIGDSLSIAIVKL